ncbi:MAG: DUF4388 domain-containing protein [Nitrospirota bacterium]
MALEGSLKDFGLADILQLIYFQKKTGVLTLEGRADRVRLLFIDGNISGAESKKRLEDNRLGKILLKKGLIKEADLTAALEEQQATGNKIGNILVNKELVNKDEIKDILKNQITETVIQIFGWKQGTYEFTTQGVPQDREFHFSIDTQHLLMEGLRIVDEWSLITGKLTLDTVFIRKTESPSGLTPDEKEIFHYIDGESDVSTIIDLSAEDSFQVSKTLISLMEKGVIAATEAAPVFAEKVVVETKKPLAILSYLSPIAIILSLIISSAVVFLQKDAVLREFKTSEKIKDLRFRIEIYRLEHSEYPRTLDIISGSADQWGRPYIYRVDENTFSLFSAGADGKEGTDDDIY